MDAGARGQLGGPRTRGCLSVARLCRWAQGEQGIDSNRRSRAEVFDAELGALRPGSGEEEGDTLTVSEGRPKEMDGPRLGRALGRELAAAICAAATPAAALVVVVVVVVGAARAARACCELHAEAVPSRLAAVWVRCADAALDCRILAPATEGLGAAVADGGGRARPACRGDDAAGAAERAPSAGVLEGGCSPRRRPAACWLDQAGARGATDRLTTCRFRLVEAGTRHQRDSCRRQGQGQHLAEEAGERAPVGRRRSVNHDKRSSTRCAKSRPAGRLNLAVAKGLVSLS